MVGESLGMPTATFERLKEALNRASGKELEQLGPDHPLSELGLDSIAMTDLVMMLEDDFQITLEREDLEGLQTLGDLTALLEARSS